VSGDADHLEFASDPEDARKLFAGPCDFVWGTGNIETLPEPSLPEVAFVGRSNVGKSSLINALTNRHALARVSHTPGRTREINFFNLGGRLMLVDLPGYGYAKASKALAQEWQRTIFAYLQGRPTLRRVMLLIDGRRGVLDIDRAVMELLDESAVSFLVVLTKFDKLTQRERGAVTSSADAEARKHTAGYPEIYATSALDMEGLEQLHVHITALAKPR
jgi:GTP-binding protein